VRRLLLHLGLVAAALLALAATATARTGPPSDPLAAQGFRLYGEYCVACHGANGQGQAPPEAGTVGFGPYRAEAEQQGIGPSLQGVGALAADFELSTGYMPLEHVGQEPRRREPRPLDDGQIRALTAYVASLGSGPAIPQPDPASGNLSEGQQLFAQHCAGCHQIAVQGGYVTGAVAWPLTKATPTQIAEAVRIGPYVMPRFPPSQISDAQLNSIIRYVEYAKHPQNLGGWSIGNIGPIPEGLIAWFLGGTILVITCIVIGTRLKGGRG
jgi:ubiquinol-cytochrome c reductase cytochrome c subunit